MRIPDRIRAWLRRRASLWRRRRAPGSEASAPAAGGRRDAGRWGEAVAERLLRQKGLRFLGRRVRVGRRGEIDLLFRDGRTLIFVEVKTRADERFGRPSEAVDRGKRQRLSRAAMRYVRTLRDKPDYLRFDVIEVVGTPDTAEPPAVRHIENAFPLEGRFYIPW